MAVRSRDGPRRAEKRHAGVHSAEGPPAISAPPRVVSRFWEGAGKAPVREGWGLATCPPARRCGRGAAAKMPACASLLLEGFGRATRPHESHRIQQQTRRDGLGGWRKRRAAQRGGGACRGVLVPLANVIAPAGSAASRPAPAEWVPGRAPARAERAAFRPLGCVDEVHGGQGRVDAVATASCHDSGQRRRAVVGLPRGERARPRLRGAPEHAGVGGRQLQRQLSAASEKRGHSLRLVLRLKQGLFRLSLSAQPRARAGALLHDRSPLPSGLHRPASGVVGGCNRRHVAAAALPSGLGYAPLPSGLPLRRRRARVWPSRPVARARARARLSSWQARKLGAGPFRLAQNGR